MFLNHRPTTFKNCPSIQGPTNVQWRSNLNNNVNAHGCVLLSPDLHELCCDAAGQGRAPSPALESVGSNRAPPCLLTRPTHSTGPGLPPIGLLVLVGAQPKNHLCPSRSPKDQTIFLPDISHVFFCILFILICFCRTLHRVSWKIAPSKKDGLANHAILLR